MAETNPAERRRPLNIEEIKERFPINSNVIVSNPRSDDEVKAVVKAVVKVVVKGVRYGGVPGSRGYSIFVDTEENRGDLAPKKRSVRPAYCRAA